MKILITGMSSGIGLLLAETLGGEEVWGLARRRPSLNMGTNFSACDVTQWDAVARVAGEIRAKWNYLDVIIHCAGTQGAVGEAMDLDPTEWVKTFRANVEGAYFIVRAFFPLLRSSRRRSKVILFSGGGASKPRPNFSAYGCAKTALVRLVETFAEEWRQFAVDINIVAPGAINTAMTQEIIDLGAEKVGQEEYERAVRQFNSGGDSIENVYSMVRFLLSEKSDGITGRFLSAQWDAIDKLSKDALANNDIFTLRRVIPEDRRLKR